LLRQVFRHIRESFAKFLKAGGMTVMSTTMDDQIPEGATALKNAPEIRGRRLLIGSRAYRIRDIERVEITHDPTSQKATVRIGAIDRTLPAQFGTAAQRRDVVGVLEDVTGQVADQLRKTIRMLDIPLIEI
jgi:hypothetical protein